MRHTIITVVAAFLPVLPVPLQSQRPQFIEPGARVRFEACTPVCRTDKGNLVAFNSDSIVLAVGESATRQALPLASVTRLETSRGQKSHAVSGGLIGLPVGVGAGLLATQPIMDALGLFGEDEDDLIYRAGIPIAGGVLGGLLGMGIGALIKTDRWEEIPLNRLWVRPMATPDGRFGLVASVRF